MNKFYQAYRADEIVEINLDSFVERSTSAFVKYLEAVKKVFPNEYETFISHLKLTFNSKENLVLDYRDYMLSLVSYRGDYPTADSFHKMRYLPQYARLKCLVDLVGRKSAIDFTKKYIDQLTYSLPVREEGPSDLESLRKMQIKSNIKGGDMDWINIKFNDHNYCNIVTKCRIYEIFKTYDSELMEVLACYPDFSMFRAINSHFVLTRTQTLMGGKNFCDTCYHDNRHAFLGHPCLSWFEGHILAY